MWAQFYMFWFKKAERDFSLMHYSLLMSNLTQDDIEKMKVLFLIRQIGYFNLVTNVAYDSSNSRLNSCFRSLICYVTNYLWVQDDSISALILEIFCPFLIKAISIF